MLLSPHYPGKKKDPSDINMKGLGFRVVSGLGFRVV